MREIELDRRTALIGRFRELRRTENKKRLMAIMKENMEQKRIVKVRQKKRKKKDQTERQVKLNRRCT